jgi:two-component system C4-dicarboxylate transport sensor histidine kinase DctB
MGALTRQLKSYARKGAEAFEPIDTRAAVSTALALMEPQLKTRSVNIIRSFPNEPIMVLGDRLRLEQVIINLLRNALDATKSSRNPTVEILLTAGDIVSIQIRDNGEGITNFDELFEPFYTTKQPGDGVGLGLAISSGIVNDLGGRLTARNAVDGGAIFEVQLPAIKQDAAAAE